MTPYYEDSAVTIYHGDCRELLPDLNGFDLLLTDPPYEMSQPPFDMACTTLNDHGCLYVFGDKRMVADKWYSQVMMPNKDLLAWHYKNSPKPRGRWRMSMQLIIYGWNDGATFSEDCARVAYTTSAKKLNGRLRPSAGRLAKCSAYNTEKGALPRDVIEWPAMTGHLSLERVGHRDQKPLGLIKLLINTVQARSVIDPFMGSGTTLRAAKDLGRKAIGIEIEERYCEIAAKRMAQEVLDFKAA